MWLQYIRGISHRDPIETRRKDQDVVFFCCLIRLIAHRDGELQISVEQ